MEEYPVKVEEGLLHYTRWAYDNEEAAKAADANGDKYTTLEHDEEAGLFYVTLTQPHEILWPTADDAEGS